MAMAMAGKTLCCFRVLLLLLLAVYVCAAEFVEEGEGEVGEVVEQSSFYGNVVELTDVSFEAAIAKYDHILVDFYAPWCHHCMRLAPELDAAAPALAGDVRPVVLAKIDAEKYSSVASQYKIRAGEWLQDALVTNLCLSSAFPTLKFFINGFSTDYTGPRHANGLVSYLRRLSAPSIETFTSEVELRRFVRSIGSEIPLFIGFGLRASDLEELAQKFRTKAWFAVLEMFSEKIMIDYDFDKGPALVVMRGEYGESHVFYGPFEESDVTEFVEQNLLQLVTPLSMETLRLVKEDGRPVVVAVLESDVTPEAKDFVKKLKMAAPANRGFVFTSVVGPEWPAFVRPFNLGKSTTLPTVLIWVGDTYAMSNNSDAFGDAVESELYKLLEGFKNNSIKLRKMRAPSLYDRARDNLFLTTVYVLVVAALLYSLWKGLDWSSFQEEPNYRGAPIGRWAEGNTFTRPFTQPLIYPKQD